MDEGQRFVLVSRVDEGGCVVVQSGGVRSALTRRQLLRTLGFAGEKGSAQAVTALSKRACARVATGNTLYIIGASSARLYMPTRRQAGATAWPLHMALKGNNNNNNNKDECH
jgi:hypothetical protein